MKQTIHERIEQISVNMRDDIYVNMYLVRGERNILIDTGITPAPQRDLLPVLKKHNLTLSDISVVLNTHGHPDHTGGNAAIKAAGGAEICIHKAEQAFLTDDRARIFDLYSAPVFEAMGGDPMAEKRMFLAMAGPVQVPDRIVEDGDVIDAGDGIKLKIIHLPGHSDGSIGIFWEEEGVLFSGDAVAGLHIGGGKIPIILDISAYKKSLQRLKGLPVSSLLCGHRYRALDFPTSSSREGDEVSVFIEQSLDLAEKIDAAIMAVLPKASGKGFVQLADEVIDILPRNMDFLPFTKVDNPFLTAQSIFFRLRELGWER
jgi:glyoxylase-like metal-dependent hydrolase (beta-lactamase superfamily II)